MFVFPESWSAVHVMKSSKFVPICNRLYARPVNSGKITTLGVPSFAARVLGESPSLSSGMNFFVTKTTVLTQSQIVTDGRTNGHLYTIAKTRLSLLSRVMNIFISSWNVNIKIFGRSTVDFNTGSYELI